MNVEYIGLIDLILVPLYFLLIYAGILFIKKRNTGNFLMDRYLVKGLFFKLACALFYAFLVLFYYGYGDTLSYFAEASQIRAAISKGEENLGVLFTDLEYVRSKHGIVAGAESGWLLEKITLVISYLCFGRFLVTTMVFAAIAYSGVFKMLETFADIMPHWHRRIALIVLFFPSVAIYGSGILKDTVCIAALGWLIFYSHTIFVKKIFRFRYLLIILFCCILLGLIKIYILAAFIIPFLFYIILNIMNKIKNVLLRRLLQPLIFAFMILVYVSFSQQIEATLGSYATERLLETVQGQQQAYKSMEDESGSFFEIGPMEQSLGGFIKKIPAGITATLFRPFIWESKKLIMLFSALESLSILMFTLYIVFKTGILKFLVGIFNNPFTFLCIMYSMLFAALVGISTLNFGTLARYRIPIIPFYLVGLLHILYQQQTFIPKTPHEKT
jgi:hypothetical protein